MSEQKPVRALVIPARPPIDKYIAAKRVYLDEGVFFRLVPAFCDVNIPTPDHYQKWEAMCTNGSGPILIDVGDEKYHKGFRSAGEMQKMASSVEGGKTWNWLVDLANENNRTGNLKSARHSVAKLVREAYHVTINQHQVWDHGMDVVDSFFWPQNRRDFQTLFDAPEHADLLELWKGFNVTEAEVLPFTLPMYFRKLFMAGRSKGEIIERVTWWVDKARLVQNEHEAARKKQYQVRRFNVWGKPAGLAHIASYFEALAFNYQWVGSGKLVMGLVRNSKGQVHIASSFRHRGVNFDELFAELDRLEPGRWYYETRFSAGPMIMNGSWQFTGVPATSLGDDELIKFVADKVSFPGSRPTPPPPLPRPNPAPAPVKKVYIARLRVKD